MRIGFVTRGVDSVAFEKITRTIKARGHDCIVINSDHILNTEDLPDVDALIVRSSPANQARVIDICRYYEAKNIPATTSSESIGVFGDKLLTSLHFEENNIPSPITRAVSIDNVDMVCKQFQYPVIIKLARGSQGKGVVIAESLRSARSVCDALFELGCSLIAQEYIEAHGTDVRFVVVDGVIASSMRRKSSSDDEFRSNISIGGRGYEYTPNEVDTELMRRIYESTNSAVMGVDVIYDTTGKAYVLEVNTSPGLHIMEVSGIDNVSKYIDYLESKVSHG
ncbi:ATP-grasp domain-containing protein [Candidatus Saccharibacteria bacterium]|nr:ATP-grasp domain-containing protein [Candidatus Saccharibacteria bacterium]